jgi:hypothetical protein
MDEMLGLVKRQGSDYWLNWLTQDAEKVGAWPMPWDALPAATRLAPGIPPSTFQAPDPAGINQVGSVYTAQGFELDYVGVIFGRDVRWDPAPEDWIGGSAESFDPIVKAAATGWASPPLLTSSVVSRCDDGSETGGSIAFRVGTRESCSGCSELGAAHEAR